MYAKNHRYKKYNLPYFLSCSHNDTTNHWQTVHRHVIHILKNKIHNEKQVQTKTLHDTKNKYIAKNINRKKIQNQYHKMTLTKKKNKTTKTLQAIEQILK